MRLEHEIRSIDTDWGSMKMVLLRPKTKQDRRLPGILWLHGGGYFEGSPEMVFVSKGMDAARAFGAVLVSPEYRLSGTAPYPAALEDCYSALKWLNDNKKELGVGHIFVGGESAGGGLTAALCMLARDRGEVEISYQTPLYPMLDCDDTESSRDNNSPIFWNTKRNHEAWKQYLGPLWGSENVPPYASPSKQTDYSNLPPCYTFVAKGEPFLDETLLYVENLKKAGIEAECGVYDAEMHAFDAVFPWKKISKDAKAAFLEHFKNRLIQLEYIKEEQK